MKARSVIGVILIVLGLFALVIGFFPGLVMAGPKPGFGPQQQFAVALGAVALLLGLVLGCRLGKGCAACSSKPEEPKSEEPKPQQ